MCAWPWNLSTGLGRPRPPTYVSAQKTLLNCPTAAIPSGERVATGEEVFGLKVPLPDVVAIQCRQESLEGTGEIRPRRLVKEALRMRPSRLIVGEVRQEESLDLLIAQNSGLPGSPVAMHAARTEWIA